MKNWVHCVFKRELTGGWMHKLLTVPGHMIRAVVAPPTAVPTAEAPPQVNSSSDSSLPSSLGVVGANATKRTWGEFLFCNYCGLTSQSNNKKPQNQ